MSAFALDDQWLKSTTAARTAEIFKAPNGFRSVSALTDMLALADASVFGRCVRAGPAARQMCLVLFAAEICGANLGCSGTSNSDPGAAHAVSSAGASAGGAANSLSSAGSAGRGGAFESNGGHSAFGGAPAHLGGASGVAGGGNAGATQSAGAGGASATALPYDPPSTPFGNTALHAEKLGFYMVPDLDPAYRQSASAPANANAKWCSWTTTQASLFKLNQLLPNAWIRWDNETGHNTSSTGNVETFVACAENAHVGMVVSADAVDGYDNYWANQYVTGTAAPNRSLTDIANGPYLSFAHDLLTRHTNVKLVETMNEPDGPWFVTDGDDTTAFDDYLGKLVSVMGSDSGRILGPSAAIKQSKIWQDYAARPNFPYFSYHTYDGWSSLEDVPGRRVHITEYGGFALDPGAILDDLWHAETNGKLSGTIERLYYHQLTDDGDNRGGFNHNEQEGAHFAFRDWLRALFFYQRVANVSGRGYTNTASPDFVASDDGKGAFAVLAWNDSADDEHGVTRVVPNTSIVGSSALFVARLLAGDANTAECKAISEQTWLQLSNAQHTVTVTLAELPAHAALLVSTTPCGDLAD